MKKLISGALMLTLALAMTGCGKGEKLTCTMTEEYTDSKTTVVATFKSDKLTDAKVTMAFADKETAESYKALLTAFSEEKMDAKVDGKNIVIKLNDEQIKDEYGDATSMKDLKAVLEDEGYTCK